MTTKADQRRYDALRKIGCIACAKRGIRSEIDVHHLTDKGTRKLSGGNKASLPLCPFHHRGQPPDGWSVAHATEFYGPSMRLEKRHFVRRFGAERELLAEVDALIAGMHS